MSLFVCTTCRSIENTALSHFWMQSATRTDDKRECSACYPETGKWHGRFERRTYDGTQRVAWLDGEWIDPNFPKEPTDAN